MNLWNRASPFDKSEDLNSKEYAGTFRVETVAIEHVVRINYR